MDEVWLQVADGARCAYHPHSEAAAVCGRCGAFTCQECARGERARCPSCEVTELQGSVPRLAKSLAWKLALVPALVGFSLGALGIGRGVPTSLPSPALLLWLVPLACGLRLLSRPSVALAWLGSLLSVALVATQLLPPALERATTTALLDLVIVGAAPTAALLTSWRLTRTTRALRWAAANA